MGALGIDVLFRGQNLARLLGGLWTALRISLISVAISLPLGLLLGIAMTRENRLVRGILRCYLEFIRIMPQLVLLFLAYFGTTRAFGWDVSGEAASIAVFTLWGAAEMIEMQLRVEDARQIIFPHPTVSEIIREALWLFDD